MATVAGRKLVSAIGAYKTRLRGQALPSDAQPVCFSAQRLITTGFGLEQTDRTRVWFFSSSSSFFWGGGANNKEDTPACPRGNLSEPKGTFLRGSPEKKKRGTHPRSPTRRCLKKKTRGVRPLSACVLVRAEARPSPCPRWPAGPWRSPGSSRSRPQRQDALSSQGPSTGDRGGGPQGSRWFFGST